MEKEIVELEKILTRIERSEKALGMRVETLNETQQALSTCQERLLVEVEEMKTLKRSLKEGLVVALKDNAQIVISQLLPPLVDGFKEHTFFLVESSQKEAQRLKSEMDKMIFEASRILSVKKRELTWRLASIYLAFCAASILTACAIGYFFPQNVYNGLSDNMLKAYQLGLATLENFDKLTQKDQTVLNEAYKAKL